MAVHVYPVNDLFEHDTESGECWCDPDKRWEDAETGGVFADGPLIIHNSADARELTE